MTTDKPLLEVRNLRKSFGGVQAVQDISFSVPTNSVLALIGPNGAGKSTLLNLMSGTFQPNYGEVWLDGRNLVGVPAHKRVKFGVARTFQSIRLFKQLSVIENVLAGFHTHHTIPFWQYVFPANAFELDEKNCHDQAMELLEFVDLSSFAEKRAGSLSYGQQRMLEIARAMATKPKLLMLDEPAAGLNSAEVDFLLSRLQQITRREITLIVVEHNMDLVMSVADHVYVMDHGEYLFQGPPEVVQSNPKVITAYLGGEFV